jgi:hypothetical protein
MRSGFVFGFVFEQRSEWKIVPGLQFGRVETERRI